MPKVLREEPVPLDYEDLGRMRPKPMKASPTPRSSGVHLSGIIQHIMITLGLLEENNERMPLCMAVGLAWEAFVVQLYPDLVWQPGEVKMDGIIGSPDGYTDTDGECILEEVKATWMSRLEKTETRGVVPPPRSITSMKRWMYQLSGYLYMMGLTKARMHVLWVNGDYRGSGPEYWTYLVEFTWEELERNWKNIFLTNKAGAIPEVH